MKVAAQIFGSILWNLTAQNLYYIVYNKLYSIMEKFYFPHTSYVSVSNASLTNILFPVTIITSGQFFAVGVHIILGFSEETNANIFHVSLP